MKKDIKPLSLIMSIIAVIVTAVVLIGTTFAWFTDSATSIGNKIKAGTLKVDLQLYDDVDGWHSIKDSNEAIFDYDKWEPGYTDVKLLKIENKGSLALQWKAKFISDSDLSELANVIDVYVLPSADEIPFPTRALENYVWVGTVADFVNTLSETTNGILLANDYSYLGIALKMQNVGNEYQGLSIGGTFDIQILATQVSNESDAFGNDYDVDATLDYVYVRTSSQLKSALRNREENIVLTENVIIDETFNVEADANIDGNGYAIARTGATTFSLTEETPSVFTGSFFNIAPNATLKLEDVIVDGGAVWTGEVNEHLQRGTVNEGVTATGALVVGTSAATLILGEGAVLQNNDGANAVYLAFRDATSKLIIDGGEIINNHSSSGAIWGGFPIVMNSGKVNGNHGGIGGAIRAVTNVGALLTMNGGEMNHNMSDDVGGAIWAGTSKSNNVYELNGGEMAYNYSPVTGGAMYPGYYETVKIGGTFKMHDNVAPVYAAIRCYDHATFIMTGGEIYNHGENAVFLYNNSASITGGKILDEIGYSAGLGLTWGNAEVTTINFNLSTNHNTAYLAKEFATLKFTVNENNANFANFNFKAAADYTYTEGDEAKLICLNDGYETYYDQANNCFKLKAI